MGKSLKLILASALCMLVSTACGGNSKKEIAANEQTTTNGKTVMAKDGKAIVVFFSHAGDNYAVGNIEVGNSRKKQGTASCPSMRATLICQSTIRCSLVDLYGGAPIRK